MIGREQEVSVSVKRVDLGQQRTLWMVGGQSLPILPILTARRDDIVPARHRQLRVDSVDKFAVAEKLSYELFDGGLEQIRVMDLATFKRPLLVVKIPMLEHQADELRENRQVPFRNGAPIDGVDLRQQLHRIARYQFCRHCS